MRVVDLVSETSELHLQERYRYARLALLLMVSVALCALVAVGLDNLRDLISRPSRPTPVSLNRSDLPPEHPFDQRSPPPIMPKLASMRLIENPDPDIASQFVQMWRVSGPEICKALREAGIETSEWRTASMRSTTYECYFQRVYKQTEARPLSSTYVKIKGNARGDVFEIRGKILGPKTADDGSLDPVLMRLFETMVQQVRWNDLQETLAPIRSLRDVDYRRFGAYFSFSRDDTSENGFNFSLNLGAASGPQTRTRQYFTPDRWARAPDPPISAALPTAFRQASR
jgi:hypothetical protein